jgi:hypothetical protein
MAINIIYTNSDDNSLSGDPIGKIIYFDKYSSPSAFFPYFYMGEKSQILNYTNWPDLVPYLYDKKLGVFILANNKYEYKSNFQISGFFNTKGKLTLRFDNNPIMINIINALIEDRTVHYLENNNSYIGWNKTVTPLSDIVYQNKILLYKDTNYYIEDLNIINLEQNNSSISINISIKDTFTYTSLNGKNIEFGLHRIPGKTKVQSVFFPGIKGKTFSTTDNVNMICGLRTVSQISGHVHKHIHNLSNHTHAMSHTHDMSNHTHYMQHTHEYSDFYAYNGTTFKVLNGNTKNLHLLASYNDQQRITMETRINTDPNYDNTSVFTGNSLEPNIKQTENVNRMGIDKDNIYTNEANFKVGNKNFSETYTVYGYIYAKKYIS